MKHIKLFLFFAIAFIFASCNEPKFYIVNIRHEICNDDVIRFIAEAPQEPVIMFYWWGYVDGKKAWSEPTESLINYDGDWEYISSDTIDVHAERGKKYKVVLRYYDDKYNTYYAADTASLP